MTPELISALTIYGPLGLGCGWFAWMFLKEREAHRRTQEGRLQELREYTRERLEDAQRHAQQISENTRTLERALSVLEGRNG